MRKSEKTPRKKDTHYVRTYIVTPTGHSLTYKPSQSQSRMLPLSHQEHQNCIRGLFLTISITCMCTCSHNLTCAQDLERERLQSRR